MAEAEKRPEAKDETVKPPDAHDAPGLSPLERMTELARRIVNVSGKELAREKRKDKEKHSHG